MFVTINAEVQDQTIEVQVKYRYSRGAKSANPRVVPDDPPQLHVERVFHEGKDITLQLTDKEFELIEVQCWQLHE